MKNKQLIKVLLIEDNPIDARLISKMLYEDSEDSNIISEFFHADRLSKGFDYLERERIDVILLDLGLADSQGMDTLRLILSREHQIPIIVVTGLTDKELAIRTVKAGAQDYLIKGQISSPLLNRSILYAIERKRIEQELHQSEEKHRTILKNIEDGYYEVDIKGNFTFFNDSMCRILGYSQEEMIGMNNRQLTDKENAKKLFQAFNKVYKTGESTKEFDWQIIKKDGTKIYIEVSVSLQKNSSGKPIGFQGIARDITERKQVEDALRESEELYRLLAEHMTDIVWIMDMNLNVTWLSPSATKARGYSVEEIKALPLDRQLTPDSLRKALNWLGKLMSLEKKGLLTEPDGIFSRELGFYCKDGHVILLDCTFQFLRDEQGKATGILAEGMDVTARKRVEEELKLTLDSLRKAFGTTIQIMVSAVEARDPYTAGHQLRSADLARSIAMELGLDQERIEGIRLAGSIHDIGKLSIPAEILSKPSKLTNIEFSLVKEHPRSGYEMLKNIESPWPLAEIVYQHHERIDGSGYPRHLKGDNIILEARIMGVADVVEAMASHRPYRAALGIEIALEEIEKNKGILYDIDVADACLRLFRKKGYSLVPKRS